MKIKLATALTMIAMVMAGAFGIDRLYARNSRVDLIALRLEQKIINDDFNNIQERIWVLEDKFSCYGYEDCMEAIKDNATAKEDYRELFEQREKLKNGLKKD